MSSTTFFYFEGRSTQGSADMLRDVKQGMFYCQDYNHAICANIARLQPVRFAPSKKCAIKTRREMEKQSIVYLPKFLPLKMKILPVALGTKGRWR
jgi:hypothetical protein